MMKNSKPFAEALEQFSREHIAQDLVRAPDPEPDHIFVNSDSQVVIRAGRDEWIGRDVEPFVVSDEHNLYEWAMVLADRHPRSAFWYAGPGTGVDDETRKDIRMTAIGLWEKSQAIFEAIVAAYESGKIKPVPVAWYKNQPADPTLLHFCRDDILNVISELGADGEVISMLMAESDQQTGSETVEAPPAGSEQPVTSERQIRAASTRPPISAPKLHKKPLTGRFTSRDHVTKKSAGRPSTYTSKPDVRGFLERIKSDPKRGLPWLKSLPPKDRDKLIRDHIKKKPLPARTTLRAWYQEWLEEQERLSVIVGN